MKERPTVRLSDGDEPPKRREPEPRSLAGGDARRRAAGTAKKASLTRRIKHLERALRDAPIVPLDEPGMNLFAKLEYGNFAGSLKDRPALWMLKGAIERGDIQEGRAVVESSSGNLAVALALYCRLLGLDFVPVVDRSVPRPTEALLRGLCREIVRVDERDDTGGFQKTRLAAVQRLCAARPELYWPNQYANLDGMMGHYHATAAEVCRAFARLDFVFLPVSSASTLAGVSRRIKEELPDARIIAVDVEGSVIFGGKPKKRHLPGLGGSVAPELLREAHIDEVVTVTEVEAAAACRDLFARHRLFAGGSSGAALAAIQRFMPLARGPVTPNVLFLCADRGTAYIDTIYDDAWVARLREAG